jgi:hypothetical protein
LPSPAPAFNSGVGSEGVRRLCRIAIRGLVVVYVLALLLFLTGTFGWFGSPQGPLAGVFLVPLGLPWNLLLDWAPDRLRAVLAAAAPILNIAILSAICARRIPAGGG